ncbi:MAG: hypothetical protein WC375_04340 [Methanomassiliicoccales archaeon]|jgi:hypothetical protein
MKIIRLAQAGGGGGFVDIEVTIDSEDGSYSSKIIGHGNGASCGGEDDAALLRDLMETKVDGFGDTFETPDDIGHTPEFYEEQRKKQKTAPVAQTPQTAKPGPFGKPSTIKAPSKKRELDLGFGV